jgi:hypothetical protein
MFYIFAVVLCIVCFVLFCVLFMCKCVPYYCQWVATQLQLRNISYTISCLFYLWPPAQCQQPCWLAMPAAKLVCFLYNTAVPL